MTCLDILYFSNASLTTDHLPQAQVFGLRPSVHSIYWSNKWIESEIAALNGPGAQRLCIGQIYANIIKRNHTPLSSPMTVAMVAFMSIVGRFRRAGCSGHSGRYCRGMIVMVRVVCAIVVIIVNYAMTVAMIIVFITLANTSSCCSFVLFTASLEYNRKHSGHQDWQQLPCLHGLSVLNAINRDGTITSRISVISWYEIIYAQVWHGLASEWNCWMLYISILSMGFCSTLRLVECRLDLVSAECIDQSKSLSHWAWLKSKPKLKHTAFPAKSRTWTAKIVLSSRK